MRIRKEYRNVLFKRTYLKFESSNPVNKWSDLKEPFGKLTYYRPQQEQQQHQSKQDQQSKAAPKIEKKEEQKETEEKENENVILDGQENCSGTIIG